MGEIHTQEIEKLLLPYSKRKQFLNKIILKTSRSKEKKTDINFTLLCETVFKKSCKSDINKMEQNIIDTVNGYEFSVNQINLWSVGNENIHEYYNQVILEIDKNLTIEKLNEALDLVISKNETLLFKTSRVTESILPVQIISDKHKKELYEYSVKENQEVDFSEISETKLGYDYDPLTNEPLRICFIKQEQADKNNFLIIRLFSLWADSYSTVFFCKEIWKAIHQPESYKKEEREVVEYKDFCAWQNQLYREPEEEGINFWKNYNVNTGQRIIPFEHNTNAEFKPERKIINVLEGDQYLDFKEKCNVIDTTLEYYILAKFITYLGQFTEKEVVFGYLPHQRNYEELDNTFGLVTKTLPIKVNEVNKVSNKELCKSLEKSIEEIAMWSDYFYLDRINLDKQDTNTVFKYSFEFIDLETSKNKSGKEFKITDIHSVTDVFDLKILGVDYGDRIAIELCYDKNKYQDLDIDLIFSQLKNHFDLNDKNNGLSIVEKNIITQSNQTDKQFDTVNSIVDLINQQAKIFPNQTAVSYKNKEISYSELINKSNQFAQYLIDNYKVAKGDPICILTDRSEWFIISVLGILKSGAYYIPIDASYPSERVEFILEDSGCDILVSNLKFKNTYSSSKISVLDPSLVTIYESEKKIKFVERVNNNDLAYCIYTSGSTGNPKGCLITHSNLLNYIQWANDFYFNRKSSGNWGLITSVSFDLTITALFTSLTRGKKLWLGEDNKEVDELLKESFTNPDIDTVKLTPSHLSLLKELDIKETNIKTIICGGEQLTNNQLNAVWDINKDIKIFNEYGPTEATVGCVVKEMHTGEERILIGKPIANTKIDILDSKGEYCKIGVFGEIFITGKGVAKGYLNRPELTSDKFIKQDDSKKEYSYKTGDIGRWLPDGNIEFIGRKDDQVKIRGYRIELGEIENQLIYKDDVDQAIVLVNDNDETKKELIAYIVGSETQDITELKGYLENRLPHYMVPSHYVFLDSLPLTVNGKIDKKHLLSLQPNETLSRVAYVAPRNSTEKRIATIWEEILQREKIGIHDDFFELGGHSLKATQLINRYHKEFEIKLGLKDIFTNTTLESHFELITQSNQTTHVSIPVVVESEDYPISDAQKRLWVLSQYSEGSVAYNMPSQVYLNGTYEIDYFKKAIEATINRHEILRTIFKVNEIGEVRQYILSKEELGFTLDYQDFRKELDKEQKVSTYIQKDSAKVFDLEKGPLLRAGLLQLADDQYVFYYNMHHIIGDGWSIRVLKKDVLSFYESFKNSEAVSLLDLKIQYKDYASWQITNKNDKESSKQKEFWLEQLSGDLPVLNLPSNKIRPGYKTYNGKSIEGYIPKQTTDKLRNFVQEQGGSLFTVLLATWNVLFYKYTAEKDIIIGSPVAGRDHSDLIDQIGFYVNTLALRNKINPEENFIQLYNKVKETTLSAFDNQMYPFDLLVEDLDVNYDAGRNKIFDIILVLQNTEENIEDLIISDAGVDLLYEIENTVSKFDLDINFKEYNNCLSFQVSYNTDVYDCEMIKELLKHYKSLVDSLLSDTENVIGSVKYLSNQEETQLLQEFNSTKVDYPKDSTIISLFKETVQRNPDTTAVVFEDKSFTYKELDKLSDNFAQYLKKKYNVQSKDRLALTLDRGEWFLVSLLGVLKLGAVYVPIDPEFPKDRIDFIIKDANCKVNITNKEIDVFKENIDTYTNYIATEKPQNPEAYVMYTSGSTGTPKGVVVEQKSIIRLVINTNYIDIKEGDKILGLSNFSFDGSTFDIFMPLLNSGTLVISSKDVFLDLKKLGEVIEQQNIDSFFLTTVFFNAIVDAKLEALQNLKCILFGGEQVSVKHVSQFKKLYPSVNLHHVYGPTENTTYSTYYEIKEVSENQKTIPIGVPISNSTCYVLDADNNLVPIGVSGEICVGGDGLSTGYLNKEELTKEKFIEHPFIKGELLYKTGDIGKWLPSGDIEFIGRKDNQVKIRGHRIELGEIENALLKLENIDNATVLIRKNVNEEKELIAYLVTPKKYSVSELRVLLKDLLSDYMLPSYFVQLDKFPLNSNGKIDKKQLPDPEKYGLSMAAEYVAPRNEVEEQLVDIFKNILQKDKIGVKDNFFELGGHSLKAMRLLNEIHKIFTIEIKIKDVYSNPTIDELAEEINLGLRLINLQKEVKNSKVIKI